MVTFNGSSMFVLSHPMMLSSRVSSRSRTLYNARTISRTAKTSVIRATTAFHRGFLSTSTRREKSIYGAHARTHPSFVVLVIDSAISGYIFTFLFFVIKWYSFSNTWSIFSRNIRERIGRITGAHRFFSSIDIEDCVLIKSNIKKT